MAQNPIKSAISASKDVAQQAQDQVESVLRDLAAAAEAQSAQAQAALQEFIDRSRENSDRISDAVDKQVKSQLSSLGIATKADIARLERKIDKLGKKAPGKKAPGKKTSGKKSAGKKTSSNTSSSGKKSSSGQQPTAERASGPTSS